MLCIPRFHCKRKKLIGQNKVKFGNYQVKIRIFSKKIGCTTHYISMCV